MDFCSFNIKHLEELFYDYMNVNIKTDLVKGRNAWIGKMTLIISATIKIYRC